MTAPVPEAAITAAARQLAHFVSGSTEQPWPEPDHEDIQWAAAALEAAMPHIAAAEPARLTLTLPELSDDEAADLRRRLADALARPPRMVLVSPAEHSRIVAYRIGGKNYHPADVEIVTELLPEASSVPTVPTGGTTP